MFTLNNNNISKIIHPQEFYRLHWRNRMSVNILLSCLILLITSIFGTALNGGAVFGSLFYGPDLILFCLQIVILAVFIFISGYGKTFLRIFSLKNTFANFELKTLKDVEKSIIYASKVAAYEAIFFVWHGLLLCKLDEYSDTGLPAFSYYFICQKYLYY